VSKAEKSSKASNKLSLEDAKQLMFWLMKREERRTKLEDEGEKAAGGETPQRFMKGRREGVATSYLAVAGKERSTQPQQNLPGRSQRDDDEAELLDISPRRWLQIYTVT
jgi:hypothetical protein